MSEDDPRAIKPPQKSPVGTAARNIMEAAAEAIPFAGIATAAGRAAFPPAEEKDRDRWAGEVTGRVNEHDKVVRSEVTIKGTTAALALWLSRTSTDGLHDPHPVTKDIPPLLGEGHSLADVEEAAEELAGYGLVTLSRHIGGSRMRPTWQLFAKVDPHAKGWNPEEDARTLARFVLEKGDGLRAPDLEQQSGFERRRFNPALSFLLTFFDPNLVSREVQPDYPTYHAHLSPGARLRLRRFINGE
jgi:hypothetical protein